MADVERGSNRDRWFPSGSWWPTLRWLLLVFAVATLLTNAYYLRFLEPLVSRRLLAFLLFGSIGLVFFIERVGLPRTREDILALTRRFAVPAVLGAILAAGFGLRLWGISSGLPQSYVADEYDTVHSTITMMKRGELNPHWWYYPSLKLYVNMGTYTAVFLAGARSGRWESVNAITVEDMLYWGRFVAVVFGTAAILLTFLLGRRLFETRVGLMAASLLAVFPSAVMQSQINKPDGMLVFMVTLSVFVTIVYLQEGGWKLALASGVVIGLATGTKYNGVLVVLPFLLAVLFRHGRRFLTAPDLYLGVGGSAVVFFVTTPFFFADLATFLNHVAFDLYTYGFAGKEGGTGVDNWYHHARYAAIFGAGILAVLAALGGLALALYRIDTRLAVALSFPVIYASVASSQRVNWAGLFIPVYPFLAILAAYAIHEAALATTRWRRAQWRRCWHWSSGSRRACRFFTTPRQPFPTPETWRENGSTKHSSQAHTSWPKGTRRSPIESASVSRRKRGPFTNPSRTIATKAWTTSLCRRRSMAATVRSTGSAARIKGSSISVLR